VQRLLLVEDDDVIRDMTRLSLERDGFAVETRADGETGLEAFHALHPDLVLLDVMLPGRDGISICREIRSQSPCPVVLLTARSDAIDIVLGLEAGADDYVTKPFDGHVLAARVRAVLRRAQVAPPAQADVLRFGDVEIDRPGMEVRLRGERVMLTPTEYRLLVDLAVNAGVVRSRDALLEDVWGYSWAGDTRLVDIHVQRIRAKLGADLIATVRGTGYKLRR
jgi:DNA-binding response OmpR family regulator